MIRTEIRFAGRQHYRATVTCILATMLAIGTVLCAPSASAAPNLLQNPGFEESARNTGTAPHWSTTVGSSGEALVASQAPHGGQQALTIPAYAAVEQKVEAAKAGAYVARGWVRSEGEQSITFLVQDTSQPWVGYTCAEIKVPANQWMQVETFCSLDRDGSLTVTLGGVSKDFRDYHGVSVTMRSTIVVDDLELFRCEPKAGPVTAWEAKEGILDWSKRSQWSQIQTSANSISGTAVIQSPHLVGIVRASDGSLEVSAIQDNHLKGRCTVVPSTPILNAKKLSQNVI